MPCSLRKLPEAFGLNATKSWYSHYFNTKENMNSVGEIPDVSYYGADTMSAKKRAEFLAWYEGQRSAVFDKRSVEEAYCQDDVTVLRQTCTVFRRDFMEIGNFDLFTESVSIASACSKVLRKRFLRPNTIGLIPTGGYSCNVNQSKKALMWLVHSERTDRCKISHGRNGREFRLPELPLLSVDGYCHEKRTVYEFHGCFWHGQPVYPFEMLKPCVRTPCLKDMNRRWLDWNELPELVIRSK